LQVNTALLDQVVQAAKAVGSVAPDAAPLTTADLLRWPGVVSAPVVDSKALEADAMALFTVALDDFVATREREGAELAECVSQRVDSVRAIVANVRVMMPEILSKQREALLARVQDLGVELETGRLEQEVALLCQKADIDEELDRLGAHLNEVERVLASDEQQGRRLDFLMQELNREANTLSSKSIVVETTRSAVDLKVFIEQMREQIQNIE